MKRQTHHRTGALGLGVSGYPDTAPLPRKNLRVNVAFERDLMAAVAIVTPSRLPDEWKKSKISAVSRTISKPTGLSKQ